MSVYLGVRLSPNSFERIKLEGINFEVKVDVLRQEASNKIQVPKDTIELIYCGNVLVDEFTLSQYGVKPGVMVHVLKKQEPPVPETRRRFTEVDVQQILFSFKRISSTPSSRMALWKLGRKEVLEKILRASPGLCDDPVAVSIIRDPILLLNLTDPDIIRRIAEKHPALIDASGHIIAAVEEQAALISPTHPAPNTGYSYTLESLLDDEESDSSGSDSAQASTSTSRHRRSRPSTITANQLAAALAFASTSQQNQPRTPLTPNLPYLDYTQRLLDSDNQASNSSDNRITSSMFSNALSQALGQVGTGADRSDDAQPAGTPGQAGTTGDSLAPQMLRMREMGLTNDATNLQALLISNGDVQAAINLVFSGAVDNN